MDTLQLGGHQRLQLGRSTLAALDCRRIDHLLGLRCEGQLLEHAASGRGLGRFWTDKGEEAIVGEFLVIGARGLAGDGNVDFGTGVEASSDQRPED